MGFVGFSVFEMICKKSIKIYSIFLWFLLFVGYCYLTVLWAPSVENATKLTTTFIQLIFVILCLTNRIKTNEDIERILLYIIISLVYTAIVLLIKTPADVWGSERIGQEIGMNSNDIGFRFAIGILLSFFFVSHRKKYVFILAIIGFFALVMFSGSRKGLIMSTIGLALCIVFSGNKKSGGKAFFNKLIKILLAAIAVFIILKIVMNNKMFYDVIGFRMESLFSAINGKSSGDASIVEREFLKEQAWQLFLHNPVLGYGHNCFSNYLQSINYGFLTYTHNNYLELLSALGVVGFLIYYSMIFSMIFNLFKIGLEKIKTNSKLLFIISLIIILVCFISWWQVNYYSKFLIVIYCITYMFIKVNKSERVLEDERKQSS